MPLGFKGAVGGDPLLTCKVAVFWPNRDGSEGWRRAIAGGMLSVSADFQSIPRRTHEAGAHAAGTAMGGEDAPRAPPGEAGEGGPGGG